MDNELEGEHTDHFKQAEDKKLLLARIVESAQYAIIGKTLDGIITSWNRGAEKIYGFSEDEMIGKPISLLAPADRKNEIQELLNKIKHHEKVRHFETERITKDGRRIDVSLTISPILDNESQIIGASTIASDITKNMQLHNELRKSEQRFRNFVKNAPIAICELDLQTQTIKYVNDLGSSLLGYAPDELLNHSIFDIMTDSSKLLLQEGFKRVLAGEKVLTSQEYTVKAKNGTAYDVVTEAILASEDGETPRLHIFVFDITARKQIEDRLRQSEERFRNFIQNAPIAIYETDPPTGQIKAANDRLCDLLGYTHDELIHMNILDILADVSKPSCEEDIVRVRAGGQFVSGLEYKMKAKNGREYDIFSQHIFIPSESGQSDHMALFCFDITKSKQAQEALRQSVERFSKMFEAHQAIMLLIDPADGQIVDANAAAVSFYGYARETLLKMKITEINQLPPDQTRREWQKAAKMEVNQFIFSHRLAGGEIREVEVYSTPITVDHKPILFSIIHDATERIHAEQALKNSESRVRHLFESMSEGFSLCEMIYDQAGKAVDYRFLMVNQPYADAFNMPVEKVIGCSIKELLPEIEPEWIEGFNQVVRTGVSERIHHRVERLKRDVEAYAWRSAPGQFGCVVTDITLHKQLQEKIDRLYKKEKMQRQKLEEEAKARALFNDILAHELKNPLTSVQSSSGMLRDLSADKDEITRRLALNIYSGVQALTRRIDDLADIGRFARGTFKLQKKPLDTEAFLRDIAERFKPALTKESKTLVVSIQGDLGVLIADQSRLEQALVNLLLNAGKYSPEKSTIRLNARVKNKKLVVEVKDEGYGIVKEELGHLFKAYYRIDKTARTPGIGLGLYISKLIVEAHQGEIRVASEVGKGSTFTVLIPTNLAAD